MRSAAPVASLADASAVIDVTTPLVGEGNIEDLADFDAPVRVPLDDPQALYERALGDLQNGDYAGARLILPRWLNVFRRINGRSLRNIGSARPFMQRQYNRRRKPFWPVTQPMRAAKKPLTTFEIGHDVDRFGRKKTGCDAFAELNAKFPDAPPPLPSAR